MVKRRIFMGEAQFGQEPATNLAQEKHTFTPENRMMWQSAIALSGEDINLDNLTTSQVNELRAGKLGPFLDQVRLNLAKDAFQDVQIEEDKAKRQARIAEYAKNAQTSSTTGPIGGEKSGIDDFARQVLPVASGQENVKPEAEEKFQNLKNAMDAAKTV